MPKLILHIALIAALILALPGQAFASAKGNCEMPLNSESHSSQIHSHGDMEGHAMTHSMGHGMDHQAMLDTQNSASDCCETECSCSSGACSSHASCQAQLSSGPFIIGFSSSLTNKHVKALGHIKSNSSSPFRPPIFA